MSDQSEQSSSSKLHLVLNLILGAVVIVVVGLNLWHFARSGGELQSVGKEAPEFSLPTMEGETFRLSETDGSVRILDFWATWCPPCVSQHNNLKKLVDTGRTPDNLRVISVNTNQPADDRRSKVRRYLQSHGSPFTTLLDNGRVSQAYGADTLPTIVVIGPDGKVTHAKAQVHSTQKLRALAWEAAGGTTPK